MYVGINLLAFHFCHTSVKILVTALACDQLWNLMLRIADENLVNMVPTTFLLIVATAPALISPV